MNEISEVKEIEGNEPQQEKGFAIMVPNRVGDRVFILHNNKAKHLRIERIDISCDADGPVIKYKLEELKKLVDTDKVFDTHEQLGAALVEKYMD